MYNKRSRIFWHSSPNEIVTWNFWLSARFTIADWVFLFHKLNVDTKCFKLIFESLVTKSGCFRFGCSEWVIGRWYIVDFGNLPFTAEINSRNSYVLFQFQILNRFSRTLSRISSKCLTFDNNKGAFGISFDIVSIQEIVKATKKKLLYKNNLIIIYLISL